MEGRHLAKWLTRYLGSVQPIRVLALSPNSVTDYSFLLVCTWEAAEDSLRSWVPATHMGYLAAVPGSWP